jgi:hypothetical protein
MDFSFIIVVGIFVGAGLLALARLVNRKQAARVSPIKGLYTPADVLGCACRYGYVEAFRVV